MYGIDLTEHYEQVTAIALTIYEDENSQLEFDDFLQDLCLKLVKLNAGPSPYDPQKSQRSTYIYMVAHGVYTKRIRDESAEEPVENLSEDEGLFRQWTQQTSLAFKSYLREQTDFKDVLPRRVFVLLDMGYTRREISSILDQTMYQVRKQKSRLVDMASTFLQSSDL